jgi:hypothetical protein
VADADPAPELRQTLFRLAELLEAEGVVYMIVGALAVAMWGRPRATADVDVTLRVDTEHLEALATRAERVGLTIDHEWLEWQPLLRAHHRRLTGPGAVVDLMRARDAHEDEALERRRYLPIDQRPLPFVAPDDLILMKLKAGRPRDFEDAMSVLIAQRETIDDRYMFDWSRRLGLADELSYVLRAAE